MNDNNPHLTELTNWCKSTGFLHVALSFYPNEENRWALRVCRHDRGMSAPIRTRHGADLEIVAAEVLPLAQESFQQQKNAIERDMKEYNKRQRNEHRNITRDIEAMHRTAGDY